MTKTILSLLIVGLLAGCGTTKTTAPKTKPIPPKAFTNTLGMKFVPIPGTGVAFCIWETWVKDYAAFATANAAELAKIEASELWKATPRPEFKLTDTYPVLRLTWDHAKAFCVWLTKKELAEGTIKPGQRYRLPTDAEWSVAVGLGKEVGSTPREKSGRIKGIYPWGKEWPPPKGAGNYQTGDDFSKSGKRLYWADPVGNYAPNKLGLYDMGGNVWEWCEDFVDPKNSTARWAHVLRGAGMMVGEHQDWLLSSFRHPYHARPPLAHLGFRCVLAND